MLRCFLPAVLLALSTGCGVLFTVVRPGEEHVEGTRLAGEVCAPVRTERRDAVVPLEGPHDHQILAIACADNTWSETAPRLYGLDPVDADPYAVAVMLAECGRSSGCLGKLQPQNPNDHEKYLAGLLAWYSSTLARDAVLATVKKAGVSSTAQTVFMDEVDTTRQNIEAVVRALKGGEKATYLDTPYDLAEDRVREQAEFAEALGPLEAIAAAARAQRSDGVSEETLIALEDLRRAYVARCGGFSCMKDPVGRAIAKELFLSHISRVDVPAAVAELPYLPEGTYMDHVDEQQRRLIRTHRTAFEVMQRGMKNGLDEDIATAATGDVEPLEFADVYPFDFSKREDPWNRMLPPPRRGKLVQYTYRVKKKVASGDTTTLYFFDEVRTWKPETCHDTNRIDRVDGGRVYYKQSCKPTGKTETMRTKREPVVVPTSEAGAIKAKEWVSYVGLTGETWSGRVTRVKRAEDSTEPIQLRGIRAK
ncbi:MAG: hypothetical protein ACRBN8_36395 [Nannocystales bacterium]